VQFLVNCTIVTGEEIVTGHCVTVDERRIRDIVSASGAPGSGDDVVDLRGLTLAPGYVDLQVNGGGDVLFSADPSPAALATMVRAHQRLGTTSILPTFITGPAEDMRSARAAALEAARSQPWAVLGVHFEGPVINPERAGVHDPRHIVRRFPYELADTSDDVRTLVTLAPESAPEGTVAELRRRGARVAQGHTNATFEVARAAIDAGADLATHLFNAMSPLTGREPGAVGAFLADPDAYVDVIPDGVHVHLGTLAAVWRAKRPGRLFFVTDAMPPVGGQRSRFRLGDRQIGVRDGRCTTEDGVLAGSALDMAAAVRIAVTQVGIPREEALRMASTYPAAYLGVDDRVGRIRPGAYANLVVLDDALQVRGVMAAGHLEWR